MKRFFMDATCFVLLLVAFAPWLWLMVAAPMAWLFLGLSIVPETISANPPVVLLGLLPMAGWTAFFIFLGSLFQ